MKKFFGLFATFTLFGTIVCYASTYKPGLSPDAFARATKITDVFAISTNATQAVTVKAIYPTLAGPVTNDLYSLTCSGNVATSTTERIVGKRAAILVTGAPVELITK